MTHTLTFVFNPRSEAVPVNQFAKSLTAILAVIDAVDYSLYQGRQRDNWLIEKLESSSPTVRMYPKRNGVDAVSVIGNGLRLISAGDFEPPPHFTEAALQKIRRMQPMLGSKAHLESIDIAIDSEHITELRTHTVENAKKILRAGYSNLGSIQGRLEALNIHNSPQGTVWDRVSGAPVRFNFSRDEIERVKALVDRRVLVSGMVSYFANGTPRGIVDVIEISDASRKEYAELAGFSSIADKGVRERGAANVVAAHWERTKD